MSEEEFRKKLFSKLDTIIIALFLNACWLAALFGLTGGSR